MIEDCLKEAGAVVLRGGGFDRWDLEVRGGLLGAARLRAVVEEHEAGRQLARFRTWPRCTRLWLVSSVLLAVLAAAAALDDAWAASVALGAIVLLLVFRAFFECAAATAALLHSLAAPVAGHQRID